MSDLIPVPFRNATLYLADVDGTPFTPMKPIVEGMGLSWQPQHEKLRQNKARWGITEIVIPTDGGQQTAICLPLRKLPGWLMTVNPKKVKPEIRETVEAYQSECDDALWSYWTKGRAENPRFVPQDFPTALRAYADEVERRQQVERELEASRPKVAFHDQVVTAETLIDFAQAFSLLQRRTGQGFTRRTFLDFLRRHGVACQPNKHANISRDRFVPRKDYTGTWFVSELAPSGEVEWMLRPMAIAGIVKLIEEDRVSAPIVAGYLTAG
jgi:hypothetical protein